MDTVTSSPELDTIHATLAAATGFPTGDAVRFKRGPAAILLLVLKDKSPRIVALIAMVSDSILI